VGRETIDWMNVQIVDACIRSGGQEAYKQKNKGQVISIYSIQSVWKRGHRQSTEASHGRLKSEKRICQSQVPKKRSARRAGGRIVVALAFTFFPIREEAGRRKGKVTAEQTIDAVYSRCGE